MSAKCRSKCPDTYSITCTRDRTHGGNHWFWWHDDTSAAYIWERRTLRIIKQPVQQKAEESTNREATPSPTVAGEHQEQESPHQSGPDASEGE